MTMQSLFILLSVFIMFSCNNTERQNRIRAEYARIANTVSSSGIMHQVISDLTVIDAENVVEIDEFELSTRITDLRYIYLKTKEPIAYISKVLLHKNRIFVSDRHINEIFIFDMEGNLIKRIADKGGGPKEYIGLGDIAVHNDELIIGDKQSLKRLYYTLDGEYIRHEKCLPCLRFAPLGDDKFVLHTDYHQSFTYDVTPNLVVSVKDSAIRRALPYHRIQKETVSGNLDFNYKGDIYFTPAVSDTIYQILTDSTFTAKFVIKHEKSLWQKYNSKMAHHEMVQLQKEGYTRLWSGFYETEKNACFQMVGGSPKIRTYWYDKATGQTYKFSPTNFNRYDDEKKFIYTEEMTSKEGFIYPEMIPTLSLGIGSSGDYYIGQIWPEEIEFLIDYRKRNKKTKDTLYFKNDELRNIIAHLDEDPNQILILYKLDFNK
jgi:hypothetical protein